MGFGKGDPFGGENGFGERREIDGSEFEMGLGGNRVWVPEERGKLTFFVS